MAHQTVAVGATSSEIALSDAVRANPLDRPMTSWRRSPVTPAALVLATTMAFAALAIAFATNVTFVAPPNPAILIVGVLAIDLVAGLAKRSQIAEATRASLYAILYLGMASIAGVLAAYAGQRLAMPLRDDLFSIADRAMGFDWVAFTHWVDGHSTVAAALKASYATMPLQILAPAVVLSFIREDRRLRIYLLAIAVGLAMTDVIAALMPALSPIASVDRATYHTLRFTGATPLQHLAQLRAPGPGLLPVSWTPRLGVFMKSEVADATTEVRA